MDYFDLNLNLSEDDKALHRAEARTLFSLGAVSMFLGHLEGCSFVNVTMLL